MADPTRLDITVQELPGEVTPAAVTWTAAGADFAVGAGFPLTGNEVILMRESNNGTGQVTVSSVDDEMGRTGDEVITLAQNIVKAFGPLKLKPWRQPLDGKCYMAANQATVEFAVLRF